jgi:hypothetical protein
MRLGYPLRPGPRYYSVASYLPRINDRVRRRCGGRRGAAGADGDGDGFEEACGDKAGGGAVEVEERVGGLVAVDAVLVAESDDGVGEPRSLLRGVDLFRDSGECGQPQPGSTCSIASRTR